MSPDPADDDITQLEFWIPSKFFAKLLAKSNELGIDYPDLCRQLIIDGVEELK